MLVFSYTVSPNGCMEGYIQAVKHITDRSVSDYSLYVFYVFCDMFATNIRDFFFLFPQGGSPLIGFRIGFFNLNYESFTIDVVL